MGGNDNDFVLKNVILWLFTVFTVLKELFKGVFFISRIYGSTNCIWRIYFVIFFRSLLNMPLKSFIFLEFDEFNKVERSWLTGNIVIISALWFPDNGVKFLCYNFIFYLLG